MKNLKMIYSLLVVVATSLFMACATDPYTPGEVPAGPQVSFSNENITSLDLSGEPGDEVQKIVLTRMVTKGALEVAILANAGDNKDLFTIPESVTFADGESVAELPITINIAAFEEDKEYAVSLLLADDTQGTPYGNSSWNVTFKLFPWELIKTETVETGQFRGGDAFTGAFEVESALAEVDVKVYKHKSRAGMYLVEDPWIKVMAPTFGYESEEAVLEDGVAHTTAHLVINCVDPEKCYIEEQTMGVNLGGQIGELKISSDYHPEDNPTGIAGTLDDGVLTWPKNGIILTLVGAKESLDSNVNGAFRLVLPGCEAVDYALAVDYKGMTVSPDNKDITAEFAFTHGVDVTGIKYYFAEGNVLANPTAAIAALIDGTASKVYSIEDFQKGTTATTINIKMESTGVFTIVAAPVSKNETLVEKFVALDSFYYSGIGDTGSHPCEITLTVGQYTDYNTDDENDDIANHNAIGYNIKGKDLKQLFIGTWLTSELTEYLAEEGNTYKTLFAEEGIESLTIEELVTVHSDAGKNGALVDLAAESDYTVVVLAVNDYEESTVVTQTYKTGLAPAYAGELVIGKYLWKYEGKEYDTIVEVKSNQGSSTKFLVSNLGYADGSEWHATYDAEKGTLTLDGTVKGHEKEGNLFGVIFGKMDDKVDYMYASVAAENSAGNNNDPLVFTVDATTKQLTGITNKRFAIYTRASGKTSTYRQFDNSNKTTIAPYVEGRTK